MKVVDQPCLVLNRNWQPTTFLPVGVAVTTVLRDMGLILEPETYQLLDWEEWTSAPRKVERQIRTSGGLVPAPEVIVLKKYGERPPQGTGFNRLRLYRRDEHTCQYCGDELGRQDLTIEHVLPRSRGGPTSWENCVAACGPCNARKADKTPGEAGMKLRKQPKPPRPSGRIKIPREPSRGQRLVLASWEPFLRKERIA